MTTHTKVKSATNPKQHMELHHLLLPRVMSLKAEWITAPLRGRQNERSIHSPYSDSIPKNNKAAWEIYMTKQSSTEMSTLRVWWFFKKKKYRNERVRKIAPHRAP